MTATLGLPAIVTEAGIYLDMSEETYHGDPVPSGSLSSSGARTILKSPARFAWERTHRVEKTTYDVGHAAHAKVLGTGMEVAAIPEALLAANGAASTKEAKEFIAQARLDGKVPLKADVIAEIDAMAEAVLTHPSARVFLEQPGQPEASGFARDPESGVWVRIRPDYLPDRHGDRTVLVDLKTAVSADPHEFGRAAAAYGYHQQDAFYREGLLLARGDNDVALVFVIVEKEPPYLVSVVELDADALLVGHDRNRRALRIYAECVRTGEWPGYSTDVELVSLPRWASYQHEQEYGE